MAHAQSKLPFMFNLHFALDAAVNYDEFYVVVGVKWIGRQKTLIYEVSNITNKCCLSLIYNMYPLYSCYLYAALHLLYLP